MLFLGVVLLIGGCAGYYVSAPKMDIIRSGLGQLAIGFSESATKEAEMWQNTYYASIIAIIAGAILIIAGAIQFSQKKRETDEVKED